LAFPDWDTCNIVIHTFAIHTVRPTPPRHTFITLILIIANHLPISNPVVSSKSARRKSIKNKLAAFSIQCNTIPLLKITSITWSEKIGPFLYYGAPLSTIRKPLTVTCCLRMSSSPIRMPHDYTVKIKKLQNVGPSWNLRLHAVSSTSASASLNRSSGFTCYEDTIL
jgi:hypothetical protein